MKRNSILLTAGLLAGLATTTCAADWQDLFDGKTLKGWVQHGGKAKYTVEDGCIVGTSVPNTGNSFLCTEKDYANFILEIEFKVDSKLNSGIQIRSQCFDQPTPCTDANGQPVKDAKGTPLKVPADRVHGYQVEIDPSPRAYSGGIYDEGRRGWLFDLKGKPEAQKAFKKDAWNKYRIECKGDSIRTWVNGVPAADLKDAVTPKGLIALQVHGIGKDETKIGTKICWRSVRIQVLD
ncbi:MAG: DUF1080 domain-containing protein [Verrucomicrobia bacterium]|nr:DUF1080 domain-containing protein [Verrucomicrobiota bacterium]